MDAYVVEWNEATQNVCSHVYIWIQTWYKYIQCLDIHNSKTRMNVMDKLYGVCSDKMQFFSPYFEYKL